MSFADPTSPRLSTSDRARALAALGRGELVGLPTETVYGLAGDATSPRAVARIFALKGRPADHPLIVHLGAVAWIEAWAREIPEGAWRLVEAFWPGPLTLILRRRPEVLPEVTGGQDTVGLRMPAHPVALELLQAFGRGLAAPSANRFGHVSPTRAEHVRAEFGSELPLVLDGGPCAFGIESTIVDLSSGSARILRPGALGAAELEAVLGQPVARGQSAHSPRVSGSLASHYAPRAPAELCPRPALAERAAALSRSHRSALVLALDTLPAGLEGLALPSDPSGYARGLYAGLRSLDQRLPDRILIEAPPQGEAWLAIHDRLGRAAR